MLCVFARLRCGLVSENAWPKRSEKRKTKFYRISDAANAIAGAVTLVRKALSLNDIYSNLIHIKILADTNKLSFITQKLFT
jgi:hypothetical protein